MASDDDWGCLLFLGIAAFAGWYAWNHYEIRKREPEAKIAPQPIRRPTGEIFVTELKDGTIWRLDADSVRGPREARQAWQISDFSKNKYVTNQTVKTLYRINCNTSAFRILSVVEYDRKNQFRDKWTQETLKSTDDYPPPNSIIDTFVNMACSRMFDADALPAFGPPPPAITVTNIPPP